ncbi:hypothetical protein C7G41_28800 [Bradyrhizobium sp. MOS002]|nr:hypothetical protein C7G41_28800 [Bradyrhizobium sp. MOS002]
MLAFGAVTVTGITIASAAPTAEVAKRCLHYAYIVHPFKRPGAVPMSPDRQSYFKDCLSKNGEVPDPSPATKKSDSGSQKS